MKFWKDIRSNVWRREPDEIGWKVLVTPNTGSNVIHGMLPDLIAGVSVLNKIMECFQERREGMALTYVKFSTTVLGLDVAKASSMYTSDEVLWSQSSFSKVRSWLNNITDLFRRRWSSCNSSCWALFARIPLSLWTTATSFWSSLWRDFMRAVSRQLSASCCATRRLSASSLSLNSLTALCSSCIRCSNRTTISFSNSLRASLVSALWPKWKKPHRRATASVPGVYIDSSCDCDTKWVWGVSQAVDDLTYIVRHLEATAFRGSFQNRNRRLYLCHSNKRFIPQKDFQGQSCENGTSHVKVLCTVSRRLTCTVIPKPFSLSSISCRRQYWFLLIVAMESVPSVCGTTYIHAIWDWQPS